MNTRAFLMLPLTIPLLIVCGALALITVVSVLFTSLTAWIIFYLNGQLDASKKLLKDLKEVLQNET